MNTGLRMSVAQMQNSLMERKTKDRQGMNSSLTVFLILRAQLSTHLLAGESPVMGGAKPPCS